MGDRSHSTAYDYVTTHIERCQLSAPPDTEKLVEAILIWNNRTDLDLHAVNCKSGEEIYYAKKESKDKKINLLIDENASSNNASEKAKEYIYFRRGIEDCEYNILVNNYASRINGNTVFAIHIQEYNNGQKGTIHSYDSDPGNNESTGKGLSQKQKVKIATIKFVDGKVEVIMDNPELDDSDRSRIRPPSPSREIETSGGYLPSADINLIARQAQGHLDGVALRLKPDSSVNPVANLANDTPILAIEADSEWIGIRHQSGTVYYMKRTNTQPVQRFTQFVLNSGGRY